MSRMRIVAALCMALFAAPASAQLIGVGVGTVVPQGTFANAAKTGLAIIAGLEVGGRIGIRAEALYANSTAKGPLLNGYVPGSSAVSGTVKVIGGAGSLVLHLGLGAIQPYVFGGAGYYKPSTSTTTSGVANEFSGLGSGNSKVGVHFGGGLKLTVIGLAAFAEARYVTVSTAGSKTNFIPVVVGIRL